MKGKTTKKFHFSNRKTRATRVRAHEKQETNKDIRKWKLVV